MMSSHVSVCVCVSVSVLLFRSQKQEDVEKLPHLVFEDESTIVREGFGTLPFSISKEVVKTIHAFGRRFYGEHKKGFICITR